MLEAEFHIDVDRGATINTRSLSEFTNICTVLKQCDVNFTYSTFLKDPLLDAAINAHSANSPTIKPDEVGADWRKPDDPADFKLR